MLNYKVKEVVEALDGAANINSAIKKFLKNEVQADPKSGKFIKSLKQVFASKVPEDKATFIAEKLPDYEPHLFVLARYAYSVPAQALADEITTKYAEEFNATYTAVENGISIKDKAKFKKIVLEVDSIIREGSKKLSLPNSGFMMNVILHHIFDKEVLEEVIPLIEHSSN